ncbi:hypothetical protein AURDEDRAFT_169830 [Auricularia subglabra TFB-10046 SS5]|nr:hypothetical protein AURDEDRAFT_169830 [Auricularia subglabra TFB-10046 SS5]
MGLPQDIHEQIFHQLPDFHTVVSLAQTCKTFHDRIFRNSIQGIMRSVAANITGSYTSFDIAQRGIRLEEALRQLVKSRAKTPLPTVLEILHEREPVSADATVRYLLVLDQRLSTGRALEIFYSRACKDRDTFDHSLLSAAESSRFQHAVQLACVVSLLYNYDKAEGPYIPNSQIAWRQAEVRKEHFFDHFSADELERLSSLWCWFASILAESQEKDRTFTTYVQRAVLRLGPPGVLGILQSANFSTERGKSLGFYTGDTSRPLEMLWAECDAVISASRRVQDTVVDSTVYTLGILTSAAGDWDICSCCGARFGVSLLCRDTRCPPPVLRRAGLMELLPDAFKRNKYDLELLGTHLGLLESKEASNLGFPEDLDAQKRAELGIDIAAGFVIRGALDPGLANAESIVKRNYDLSTGGVAGNDLLCVRCIKRSLETRLWAWWLVQREATHVFVQPNYHDCWWGVNCRKQMTRAHAEKFNHACLPCEVHAADVVEEKRLKKERAAKRRADAEAAGIELPKKPKPGALKVPRRVLRRRRRRRAAFLATL